ncbi:two-partner secretion domain-containing protein, partial [Sulfurirhabdus autotrophica]
MNSDHTNIETREFIPQWVALFSKRKVTSSIFVLWACGVLSCTAAIADTTVAPVLPSGTLPVASASWRGSAATLANDPTRSGNTLTINQISQSAIFNWQSFNIARDSAVVFNQPNSSATALNRIFDNNPSVIQGHLTANGQIYLVNQNGIIFGKDSQVNASSLIASSLNIEDTIFNGGIGNVKDGSPVFAGGSGSGFIRVEEGANLSASTGGKIMLFAPNVENHGVITTPDGQTILAAGSKVYLTSIDDATNLQNTGNLGNGASLSNNLRGLLVEVDNGGTAANLGTILAERGNATLIGLAVNQQGRITATTSVNANGSIRLLARDTVTSILRANGSGSTDKFVNATNTGTVTLGDGSVTEVLPDLKDTATSPDAQQFNPSRVEVVGNQINMLGNSKIIATGGQVTLSAVENPLTLKPFDLPLTVPGTAKNSSRVFLDSGSLIDVSGSKDVPVAIERNLVQVDLYGAELKDSPLQSNSFLHGKTVSVDISKGTPLADYSGYESKIERSVAERTSTGGTVKIASEGDIVMKDGGKIDVSGGSIKYLDGFLNTTKLISQGVVYDISEASPDRIYDGFAGVLTRDYSKWGVTKTWTAPSVASGRGDPASGYTEGKNAGTVQFFAPSMVLNGSIVGQTTAGIYQRQPYSEIDSGNPASALYKARYTMAPKGATLVIGDVSHITDSVPPDFKTPDVSIVASAAPLLAGFNQGNALPADRVNSVQLSAGMMGKNAVSNLEVYSNGKVDVAADARLNMPDGSVKLAGNEVNVSGSITAQSGKITLQAQSVNGQAGKSVTVSGVLDASGGWINDSLYPAGFAPQDPLLVKGGAIDINAYSNIVLSNTSKLDVSSGGWLKGNGKLGSGADAGAISIKSGMGQPALQLNESALTLDGSLSGYALNKGGSLAVSTSKVKIGGQVESGVLVLPERFFTAGGFNSYKVNGIESLSVAAGTTIDAKAESLILKPASQSAPTGSRMASISQHALLDPLLRKPVSLTLSSDNVNRGTLQLEQNAVLRVEPKGTVNLVAGRQMTLSGTVEAPAGAINLTMLGTPGTSGEVGFLSNQSIWLDHNAQLLSRGADQTHPDAVNGLRQGEVLNGGVISIVANKGYVVAESGSVMDVSGTSGTVDILRSSANGTSYQPVAVASDAGSISISTREGALLDGSMIGKAGGKGAQAGTFSLSVDTKNNLAIPSDQVTNPYPTNDRQIILAQHAGFLPAGIKPEDVINTANYNGKGMVAADSLKVGGFSQVELQAQQAVRFSGDVSLDTARAITLDAPVIAATHDAIVNLNTRYLHIANSDANYQTIPVAQTGTAKLTGNADLIDLEGNVALSGFTHTALNSNGDIRLKGVWNNDTVNPALTGALSAWSDLSLLARQIYPTTLTQFNLGVLSNDSLGQIRIATTGAVDTPVLSAGGKLTVVAANILQEGVIKAPLGTIAFKASENLTIGKDSITSASAEGQIIPLGGTSNGKDWLYTLNQDAKIAILKPTEKIVSLDGKNVTVEPGAKVDISGGGDIFGTEFLPGPPTRSVDILNAPDTFAVMPGLNGTYAPYDAQSYTGSTVKPGDSVYLSGMAGLPAGVYTLLPARYALLPGAFMVQAVGGYRDMLPQQPIIQADGTNIVAGYRTVVNQVNDSTRFSGFAVRTGTDIKKEAVYLESYGNKFFTDNVVSGAITPRLPMDAGQLILSATQTFSLGGSPLIANKAGGKGAIVDIVAQSLAVGGANDIPAGYVGIDTVSLNSLGAESLLLGGTRSVASDGQVITTKSDNLFIATSVDNALKAPEVLLVAKDKLTVSKGSIIQAAGSVDASQNLILGRDGNGDGALLRVSPGDYAAVKRENVSKVTGTLDVQNNVVLDGKSIVLDATLSTVSAAELKIHGGSLSLGANLINLGETTGLSNGLALPNALLAALGSIDSLYLKSYSTIDFYGNVKVGGATADQTINHLSLDAAGLRGYGKNANEASLVAGDITLKNNGSATTLLAPVSGMSLSLSGKRNVTVGAGEKQVSGFASVGMITDGEISGNGTGSLKVNGGDLSLQAARLTTASNSDQSLTADGKVSIARSVNALTLADAPINGRLAISGKSIEQNGNIELPAGIVKLTATGIAAEDNVTLGAGSNMNVAGVAKPFGDVTVSAPGGHVILTSANGNVDIKSGAEIDVSGSKEGGDAGSVTTIATQGKVNLAGVVKGSAQSGSHQGSYTQDSKTLTSFTALNTSLEAGSFGEQRNIRVRQGDIEIDAGDEAHAHQFILAADAGKIDVKGKVDASGDKGGDVLIAARDNVTLYNGSSLNAHGKVSHGGTVELSTTSGMLDGQVGSRIDVSGATVNVAKDGGKVILRAPVDNGLVDAADASKGIKGIAAQLGSSVIANGARDVIAEAVTVYDNFSSITSSTLAAGQVQNGIGNLMANATAIEKRLGNNAQLRAGIEIRSTGDLALNTDLNLSAAFDPATNAGWNFAGRPVDLILRAAGNLNINGTLSDGFVGSTSSAALANGASASYKLVAGADLNAANPLALISKENLTSSNKGNVNIAADKLVRTGTGSIAVAAGNNIALGNSNSAIYTAGETADPLSGFTASDAQAIYAKNGGNLSIYAQGDIKGQTSNQIVTDWLYRQGQVNTDSTFAANSNPSWWLHLVPVTTTNKITKKTTTSGGFMQNFGTLGGGDLELVAGGNITNASAVIPTTGRVSGSNVATAKIDVQGGGDL